MLPLLNSGTYDTSQLIDWRIDHYESSMSVPETGIGFRMGQPSSSFTNADMAAAADPAAYMESNSTAVFTDTGGNWKYGRSPLVHSYWEAGAPIGISVARYAVLHWRGYAADDSWTRSTGKFKLAFAGRGNIRVIYNSVEVLSATVLSDIDVVYTDWLTWGASDQLDIYYWQLGENWGGVVGKYVPQKHFDHEPSEQDYRDAPVISASLFPYTTATATELSGVEKATMQVDGANSVSTMNFEVALRSNEDVDGWALSQTPPSLSYTESGSTTTLKRGQLVKLFGGFVDEQYQRFSGRIVDFKTSSGKATVYCESHDSRMTTTNVENYPDRLSYLTFKYLTSDSTSEPIRNVPAYDYWPMEYVVRDLCYKSGIDPKVLSGYKQIEESNQHVDNRDRLGTVQFTDLFTDSNGTAIASHVPDTGQDWELGSGITIQSNAASKTTSGVVNAQIAVDSGTSLGTWDNARIQGVFNYTGGMAAGTVGLLFRADGQASVTGYQFYASRTSTTQVTLKLDKMVAGTPTNLYQTTGYSWASGTAKQLSVDIEGNDFKLYIADSDGSNRSLLTTVTNSDITSTSKYCGIALAGNGSSAVTCDSMYVYSHYFLPLFDATSLSGDKIRLQRQPKYGNSTYDFDDDEDTDDPYIYKPDASKSPLDWARDITDGFGYDFRTNVYGNFVLESHNLPHRARDLSGGTTVYEANSFSGFYQKHTSTFTTTEIVHASRIDLVVGRKSTLGVLDYSVNRTDGTLLSSGTVDLALAGETSGIFLYDDRFAVDGSNACVVTLYTGDYQEYVVTLSDGSGSEWWLDALFLYDHDPDSSQLSEPLQTDKAVLDLSVDMAARDARNRVVVIGKRKITATDSEKFRNPNNPQYEFFVSSAADPSAIWDQDYELYVGTPETIVLVDDTITDQDFADWVAQTLLVRQRSPDSSPTIRHTLLPGMEPRDCVTVNDARFSSISASVKVWVTSFSEEYTLSSAMTSVNTTAYRDVSSFEPVAGLSLDVLESVFLGNPVIDVNVSYPSIDSGIVVTNPGPNAVSRVTQWVDTTGTVSSDGNGDYIDLSGESVWPPLPESIALIPTDGKHNALKNNPYAKFWHIYDYTTGKLHIPFESGDGTANYARAGWAYGGSPVRVKYRGLPTSTVVYNNQSPFYDPYTSELPDAGLVSITFDALVTGYYRVSLWALSSEGDAIPVAWLTEPAEDAEDRDKHWEYVRAGKDRLYVWDGVDNIGEWNEIQSENYSWNARGAFNHEEQPRIGKGFYLWNEVRGDVMTISGQKSSGKLVFGDGRYSQLYVKIECRSDVFADTDDPVREVRSDNLEVSGSQNSQNEIYIYTHLPEPSKVTLSAIEDWDSTATAWTEDTVDESGWITSQDAGATFRNNKPVRFTYAAVARPGNRFGGDASLTTFKLFRQVHLNANIFDMFLINEGLPWNTASFVTKKRLVSRKLTNSEHTTVYSDANFRRGDSLADAKWVFYPKKFKIDDRSIQYCDYLQLENVPSYVQNAAIGQASSRFIMGYINYLFYMSAYIQDRSGRFMGVIDDTYVDKGKITQGTFATEFPDDPEVKFNKTFVVRQWNDPSYIDDMISTWTITDDAAHRKYIQFFWPRLEPEDTAAGGVLRLNSDGTTVTGNMETIYTDLHTSDAVNVPGTFSFNRQLGSYNKGTQTLTNYFGDWTWEGTTSLVGTQGVDVDPLWIPAPTRDWHGYYLIPPMSTPPGSDNPDDYWYETVQKDGNQDPTSSEVWYSLTAGMSRQTGKWDYGFTFDKYRLKPGLTAEEALDEDYKAFGDLMTYSRQDELLHYEEFRGWLTGSGWESKTRPQGAVVVQPAAGQYAMNFYKYDEPTFATLQTSFDQAPFKSKYIWADVMEPADPPTNYAWFAASFRYQYNWESSRYFPINKATTAAADMRFEFVNIAHAENTSLPAGITYDAGAYVGWKDDSSGTKLRWVTAATSTGGEGRNEANIFRYYVPTMAVGPETPERTDILVSLVLENRRRGTPVE